MSLTRSLPGYWPMSDRRPLEIRSVHTMLLFARISCQPLPQVGVNRGAAQQFKVIHPVGDPLPVFRKVQRSVWVRVAAQSAVQRHQAVPKKKALEVVVLLACAARNRVAAHCGW